MFKNSFLYILAMVVFFAGCEKKTDEVFDRTPDQRLAESLAAYQQA